MDTGPGLVGLTAAGSGRGSANPKGPQNLTCIRGQSPLTLRISLSSDGPSRRERDRHTATPNGLALWGKERNEHVTPRAAHVGHGSRWVAPNPGLLSPCLGWGDLQTSTVTQGRLGGKGRGGRRQVLSLTCLKLNYMSRQVHFPCKQLKYTQNTILHLKTQCSHFSAEGHSGHFPFAAVTNLGQAAPTPLTLSGSRWHRGVGTAVGSLRLPSWRLGRGPSLQHSCPQTRPASGSSPGARRMPRHLFLIPGFPLKRPLPLTLPWRASSHPQVVLKLPLKTITPATPRG